MAEKKNVYIKWNGRRAPFAELTGAGLGIGFEFGFWLRFAFASAFAFAFASDSAI